MPQLRSRARVEIRAAISHPADDVDDEYDE